MLKKIAVVLVTLSIGVYMGLKLPRGAGLIATVMNFTSQSSEDYSATASHQAFLDMESMISKARKMVLKDARSEQEAVEGMRWLLRVISMSTEVAADGNPKQPHFQRMDTAVRKIGGDNPDAEYELAQIDGQYDYRISGNVGTIRYLGFTINGGQGMTPRRQVAYTSDKALTLDEDGNFVFILAQTKPEIEGDWIEIPEDASSILVREYIADRENEILPTLKIEIIGEKPPFSPPTDREIADSIIGTSYAFLKLTTLHKTILPELLEEHHRFIRATSENLGGSVSGIDNLYMIGSYQLADDEALVVEVMPPKVRYWNFTLSTRWHEIINYLHRPTSRTLEDVTYEADGSVQFLISHTDPGHPNWLDTSGYAFGFMTFRWIDGKGQEIAMPKTRVVKLSELGVDARPQS
ncbi:MAG: DUF1214 domain-containing protein [Myxococcota bacterium]